ncbi:MAG: hypothetical protein NC117_02415 [Pseudoflavonifractor sp.]|nr:hypothetical protein [Pseudoflavonifractor sp.]
MKTTRHNGLYPTIDMTALAVMVTVAIIISGIVLVTDSTADEPLGEYATAYHDIRAALDEYNDGLPAESEGVIYEKTSVEGNCVVYRYTLLDEEIAEIDLDAMYGNLTESVVGTPEDMELASMALRARCGYRFEYTDRNGKTAVIPITMDELADLVSAKQYTATL